MRDYSFGNFISAIRERRGLSQYQLGALIGVTDKAVSKWENGVSKPRISTMTKLADVLDVSVEELLSCEYNTFEEKKKDLFAMRNNIIEKAKNRIFELYGERPPIQITNRFQTELLMMDGRESLIWMGFFGKLNDHASKEDFFFQNRSSQMCASFVAWLLGGTDVNPLPAHYYCPKCKKVEFISNRKYGIDAPKKLCSCGEVYLQDGFGIDAMNMYPFVKNNEVYVSGNTTDKIRTYLKDYFDEYGVIREIVLKKEDNENRPYQNLESFKFILLSNELAKKYDAVINVNAEEYYALISEFTTLNVIEEVDSHPGSIDLSNLNISTDVLNDFIKQVVVNDDLFYYGGNEKLKSIALNIEKPSFEDIIAIYGLFSGTGTWKDHGEMLYEQGISLNEMISNREMVYSYLYEKLQQDGFENPSGLVYNIKENVFKGKYNRNSMPEDIEQLLETSGIPKWYIESLKKVQYLFPVTYLVTYVKKRLYEF